ncbi:MAG: hypothetical protein EBR95_06570 [Verrucomicrobia bacterium]|nr:hypothetical protein [Verrucomicrobiota bacterium]
MWYARLLTPLLLCLLLVGCASGPLLVDADPPVIVAPDLRSAFGDPWKIPHGEWKPDDGVLRMTEIPARKHVPVLQHWVGLKTAVIELEFRQDTPTTFYIGCDGEKHVGRVVITPKEVHIAEDSVKPSHVLARLPLEPVKGVWRHVRVEWTADRMAVRIDGQRLQASHPFLATAKTRSWIAGSKAAEVRNFVIKGVAQ